MQITGPEGWLERGGRVAVRVGPYTVTRTKLQSCCTLRAPVTQVVDAFQLAQAGLRFVTRIGPRLWTWQVASPCRLVDGTVVAELSARPESE